MHKRIHERFLDTLDDHCHVSYSNNIGFSLNIAIKFSPGKYLVCRLADNIFDLMGFNYNCKVPVCHFDHGAGLEETARP